MSSKLSLTFKRILLALLVFFVTFIIAFGITRAFHSIFNTTSNQAHETAKTNLASSSSSKVKKKSTTEKGKNKQTSKTTQPKPTVTEDLKAEESSDVATATHVVATGETWYRIAYNNNLTTAQLKAINPGVVDLKAGMSIKIPQTANT